MSHCRLNAVHWSGPHPAEMQGGINLSFYVAKGTGVVLSGQFYHGSGELLSNQLQMLHPGPGTSNHIPLLGIVTLAFYGPARPAHYMK